MNYNNFGNQQPAAEVGVRNGRPPGSFHLARQGSIYSLTFDELQNTMGSMGKDFGSMNMDELLKSIWNAEEIQTTGNGVQHGGSGAGAGDSGGVNIQRQGSLTLPRTLSQKTVDEVWKDISKEFNGFGQPDLPQRQQTLGEMTLEEFLVKAGVVREEQQLVNNGLFSNLTNTENAPGFGAIGFQQGASRNANLNVNNNYNNNSTNNNNNQIVFKNANLPLNVNGVRSTQNQQKNQQLFPKQSNKQLGGNPVNGNKLVSNGVMGGMVGLGAAAGGGVTVAVGSPVVSSDGGGGGGGGVTSSVSPSPYEFSGIVRGRKSGTVEKVVERRQRRMIKNRESAARSRARKQAYTTELEAEVSKLKEQNQELKRKVMEMMNTQSGAKRRRMRRTQSGPW